MTDSKFEQNAASSNDVVEDDYEAPSMFIVGKVVELTSGPVTVHPEGTGLGFKS